MRLQKALDEKKFDLRIRDRLLAEGKITNAELESYLNEMTDDSSNISQPKTPNTATDSSTEIE